jgi:glutathione peroxidase-family protein
VKGNIQNLFNGSIPSNVDVFTKVSVNGSEESPVITYLKRSSGDTSEIGWNFRGKFIVSPDGSTVQRSMEMPKGLEPKLKQLMGV